jgi:K+-transporting ATPase KdpF subunit
MSTLSLVYWLAGGFAFGLFVYLGYALLRPEQF